jgi:hypothetical protein
VNWTALNMMPKGNTLVKTLLSETRAILSITPARWQSLVGTISPDLLTRPPLPGEWSAAACLQHLLDTERRVFPVRVRALLAGQDFPGFNPATDGSHADDQTPAELAAAFARARAESLALLEQVTDQDLTRTARHSTLGLMSLEEVLHGWVAHDLNHTIQAERALMQPFIAGSGALRFRFKDHDVGAPAAPGE